MRDYIYTILQRIGKSFMLPIAVLPVAGLILGLGSSFTNETMIKAYHVQWLLGSGTPLRGLLLVMKAAGNSIFDNLPVIFAVGIAIGMAYKQKEVAALSSIIAYFVMNSSINAILTLKGDLLLDGTPSSDILKGTITEVLGIPTLEMGVFGGIIVGLGVAFLHNRFHTIQLPNAISFFAGVRFVPIISVITYVFVGILLCFVWPPIQSVISTMGKGVASAGYFGIFLFGAIKRTLIPFGLHHVFYLPFWQTALGGSLEVGGRLVQGAQSIFFAQLADPNTVHFSVDACKYFTGEYLFMMFGLPGAAFAMYRCARPERKKQVGGLLLSAALTSMLTGITEPIEFSFLFAAPILFVVHVILGGFSYLIAQMFRITIGLTFSAGFFDFLIFGILQGNDKTNWILILPLGIFYFALYYTIFHTLILKFNLKTPGREEPGEVTKLYTRTDLSQKKEKKTVDLEYAKLGAKIVEAVGGKSNILDVDCCATRLRFVLRNRKLIKEDEIRKTGSAGILKTGSNIQIIYGPYVTTLKESVEAYIESEDSDQVEIIDMDQKIQKEDIVEYVKSPLLGKKISLDKVNDEVFSAGMLGRGFAVIPENGRIYAPVNGVISAIFDTKHAIAFQSETGAEILVHIGINTVKLNGEYFYLFVENGQSVAMGELIGEFNLKAIEELGYDLTTPVVVVNPKDYKKIEMDLEKEEVLRLTK